MKKILIALISIISINMAAAQNVNIPDASFKAALVGNASINTNMDTEIQLTEANAYSGSIHVNNLGITDFTGLEEFILLDSLECVGNSIWYYDLQNGVWALSSAPLLNVSANTALTYLNCANNQLTNLNVSANIALTYLTCVGNSLTSLNLSANTLLTYLHTGDEGMLPQFTSQLTSLDVSGCSALTYLNCFGNSLTSLNVSSCTALSFLDCYANSLTNLDVSANTALIYLRCGVNQLTNLDVSANIALTDLNCRINSLTSLNVSANTALTNLYCDDNLLTSLDVSANTALTDFDCSANQLTNLNVKNGNNPFMNFYAVNNPNLSCIEVDTAAWSASNWSNYIDATAFFSENCSGVGINTIGQSKALQVYPNPTTGNIYLTANSTLELTDLAGQVLLQKTNTKQLDISGWPAGMYLLHVGQNAKQTFKVIKE